MRGKLLFIGGLAAGFVLGSRAGREKYEEIRAGAKKVWENPTVQEAAGVASPSGTANLRHRLSARTGVRRGGPVEVTAAAHHVVGASPSVLAAVGLEDLLGVEHRPNIPATQRPENWTRPLPVLIDDLDGPLRAVAALVDRPPAVLPSAIGAHRR